jgi:hypothetical protein
MSNWVIRKDQSIVKTMDYFKMEMASMALPMLSQTPYWHRCNEAFFHLYGSANELYS